jgi:hypothetical protein
MTSTTSSAIVVAASAVVVAPSSSCRSSKHQLEKQSLDEGRQSEQLQLCEEAVLLHSSVASLDSATDGSDNRTTTASDVTAATTAGAAAADGRKEACSGSSSSSQTASHGGSVSPSVDKKRTPTSTVALDKSMRKSGRSSLVGFEAGIQHDPADLLVGLLDLVNDTMNRVSEAESNRTGLGTKQNSLTRLFRFETSTELKCSCGCPPLQSSTKEYSWVHDVVLPYATGQGAVGLQQLIDSQSANVDWVCDYCKLQNAVRMSLNELFDIEFDA